MGTIHYMDEMLRTAVGSIIDIASSRRRAALTATKCQRDELLDSASFTSDTACAAGMQQHCNSISLCKVSAWRENAWEDPTKRVT